ncbi:MAG: hypothetical protein HY482_00685 [Candidatus Wildermuthbacteria bacterium]|nr:hypothetical protein [Candidatus Wildermuthbacteria bacterium]
MKRFFSSSVFVYLVIAFVAGSVAYGIFLSGSPAANRLIQLDQRRVSDLQQIAYAVEYYADRYKALPKDLNTLKGESGVYINSATDPVTGESYEYRAVSIAEYELCAVFSAEAFPAQVSGQGRMAVPAKPFSEQIWDHGIGRVCFSRILPPEWSRMQPEDIR